MIYKYSLDVYRNSFALPNGSTPRYVGVQNNKLCLWVEMGKGPVTNYTFQVVGTGWEEDYTNYVGSAQIGEYAWHVYQV